KAQPYEGRITHNEQLFATQWKCTGSKERHQYAFEECIFGPGNKGREVVKENNEQADKTDGSGRQVDQQGKHDKTKTNRGDNIEQEYVEMNIKPHSEIHHGKVKQDQDNTP